MKHTEKNTGTGAAKARLTDKEEMFCQVYVRRHNAARSYRDVYICSEQCSYTKARALLKKPKIKNRIHEIQRERCEEFLLSEEDVLRKHLDILTADMNDYIEIIDGNVRLKQGFDGTLIKTISCQSGNFRIELLDKTASLKFLGDYIGCLTQPERAKMELVKAQAVKGNEDDNSEAYGVVLIPE